MCKKKQPKIPTYLQRRLVEKYVELREHARANMETSVFTSPRNLLAVVRMATAHARLHLREVVNDADIEESLRLLDACKASIESDIGHVDIRYDFFIFVIYHWTFDFFRRKDPVDSVFDLIRSFIDNENRTITRNKLLQEAQLRGLTDDHIQKCIQKYPDLLYLEDDNISLAI